MRIWIRAFLVLGLAWLVGCTTTPSAQQLADWAAGKTRIDPSTFAERGQELRRQKKLICFDLDGTLTQHRSPLAPENRAVLDRLGRRYELVMCGGGNCTRIFKQMRNYPIRILGNYGMEESEVSDGQFRIVRNVAVPINRDDFQRKTNALRQKYGYTDYWGDALTFHPSGMVTFGLLGTKAPLEKMLAFDPDKAKRRAMLADMTKTFPECAVFIGGTTSFDITPKEYDKYHAVMRYAKEHGFSKEQVLFVGDDLTDGGNDSHIRLYGMDYIQVMDYRKLPDLLRFLWEDEKK